MQARLNPAGPTPAHILHYLPVLGLLALAIALAVIGALQAADSIADGIRDAASFEVGQAIPTGYGSLTVSQVEKVDGLTSQDLSGVTHGIQNLVLSDKVQVQVSLQFANRSTESVRIAPGQFTLFVEGSQDGHGAASGTLQSAELPAHANLNAEVDFVTPRTNRPLWVEYRDPHRPQPVRIAVGPADPNAGEAPSAPANQEHSHANQ